MIPQAMTQIFAMVPDGFYASGRLLYCAGTNLFLFQTTKLFISLLLYLLYGLLL